MAAELVVPSMTSPQLGARTSDVAAAREAATASQIVTQAPPPPDPRTQELREQRAEVQKEISRVQAQLNAAVKLESGRREQLRKDFAAKRTRGEVVTFKEEKMLRDSRQMEKGEVERFSQKISRLRERATAYDNALAKGTPFSQELKRAQSKRFKAPSTTQQLQSQASKGDPDAAAALALKERLKARGTFQSRVIPKFTGEVVGKQTGV